MFTLTQCFDDEGEGEEAEEEDIEFLESGEDSAEALQPSEQPLDLIALLVKRTVVLPRLDAVGLGRNDGDHAEAEHKLSGFVAFIGPIPSALAGPPAWGRAQSAERVLRARRERC